MKTSLRISRTSMLAALGILCMPALSHGADVAGEEAPVPSAPLEGAPLNTWSGPYAGVTLGYGFGTSRAGVGDVDTDGLLGGGFIGYNFQDGPLVYGVEGDLGFNGATGSLGGTTAKAGFEGSLRARMGLTVTSDILVYGTAGGAASRIEVSDVAGSAASVPLGWTAGAGVDVNLTESVFGRAEYRYIGLGSKSLNTGSGPQSVDTSGNRVQFGLGMKF